MLCHNRVPYSTSSYIFILESRHKPVLFFSETSRDEIRSPRDMHLHGTRLFTFDVFNRLPNQVTLTQSHLHVYMHTYIYIIFITLLLSSFCPES